MISGEYYIHINGYVIQELKLRGYEAMCYGLIESFSQAKMGHFKGGQEEIADALGITRKTANEILSKLEQKGLIEKSVVYDDNLGKRISVIATKVTIRYITQSNDSLQYSDQINDSSQNQKVPPFSPPKEKVSPITPLKEIPPYNPPTKIDNNPPLYSPQGETPQESISKNKKSAKAKPSATDAPLVLPFSGHKTVSAWYELCAMPKWKNKPKSAIEKVLKKLSKYSDDVVLAAIEDAIMGNYQGIFPDKFVKKVPLAPQPPKPKYVDIKDIM